jgi:hypothetical protein
MTETNYTLQGHTDSGFGSGSDSLTGSILPAYVLKKLLKPPEYYGDPSPFAVKGEVDEATGKTVRFTRYRPLARPRANATETSMATPLSMTADSITATIEFWEAFTRFSSRANFYLAHSVFQNALSLHNELFHRVGRLNIFDVLMAGTNTFFGLSANGIASLTTTSYDVGEQLSNVISKFRRNGTKPVDGMYYPAFCNPDVINLIDKHDTQYQDAETFQGRGMYDLEVKVWRGATTYPTNLLPVRQLDSSSITEATATTGGTLPQNTTYYYKVAAINPLTGQVEKITAEGSHATGAGAPSTHTISLTMPAASAIELEPNTNYVYDVYWGTTTGDANLYLQTNLLSNAAGAVVAVGAAATVGSGTTAPVTPASGVKVTPIIVLGDEAYGNIYSSLYPYGNFKPAVVGSAPTAGNEVGKIRSVGWSLDMKPVILNQQRMAVIWIGYS